MDEGFDRKDEISAQAFHGDFRRRSELASFLEEISARTPSPIEIVEAVRQAAADELSPRRLDEISRSIFALFRPR